MKMNLDKKTLIALFSIFSLTNADDRKKIRGFLLENFSTDRKLSINTLMEELKPMDMEKLEIEQRDLSKVQAFFCISGLSRFRLNEEDR